MLTIQLYHILQILYFLLVSLSQNSSLQYNITHFIILTNDLARHPTSELKWHCWNTSIVDDAFIRLRFSFLAASNQDLQDWKAVTAPQLPQKRRWSLAAALRPWMLVPELLVALAAEVRLTQIGVSKTNDHLREYK
ncbi:Hypothetical_protein [Hexamita inflata]|uniref:Hypothetical_protein n=1 Tax=Hexamita inflata TaxID=28002 RepID=A0AA86R1S2_9EUKA|nr:Hypothetical protein HINF_LOCUS56345 [Hexamita inflata]